MKRPHSSLEADFARMWSLMGFVALEEEHRFAPPRRWRFDFADTAAKVAVEIEGGTWVNGRHTRGGGFAKDCEKYNTAALDGWLVFRLTRDMVTQEWLGKIGAVVEQRRKRVLTRDIRR